MRCKGMSAIVGYVGYVTCSGIGVHKVALPEYTYFEVVDLSE